MPLSLSLPHQPKQQVSNASSAAPNQTVSRGSPAGGVDSHDILKGEKAVAIHHNGLTYRLQATRLGKLILTK